MQRAGAGIDSDGVFGLTIRRKGLLKGSDIGPENEGGVLQGLRQGLIDFRLDASILRFQIN